MHRGKKRTIALKKRTTVKIVAIVFKVRFLHYLSDSGKSFLIKGMLLKCIKFPLKRGKAYEKLLLALSFLWKDFKSLARATNHD